MIAGALIEELSLESRHAALLRDHPLREIEHRGVRFTYRAVGRGDVGLLLLPGAAGGGEGYLPLLPDLEASHRMILVHYPRCRELEVLVGGLAAILDAEGLAETALIGGSFGGMVAQAFLARLPHRTTRVLLSATAAPELDRAARNERRLRVFRFFSMTLFRSLLRLAVFVMTRRVGPGRRFWRRFYYAAIGDLDRSRMVDRYRLSIDFDRSTRLDDGRLEGWTGRVMVLAGSADGMTGERSVEGLRRCFPDAEVRVFEGSGHGISLERPAAWRQAVVGFLTA
jgi:pimeloyl-ACP methyl ester carboxylesterase